tara:strand:+ start:508 stop:633 length:126 start_codon:yes stop_codon:yes gene_type:complete
MNKIIWKKYSYHLMIKKEQKEQNKKVPKSSKKVPKNNKILQ